jgi:hypothetical protein
MSASAASSLFALISQGFLGVLPAVLGALFDVLQASEEFDTQTQVRGLLCGKPLTHRPAAATCERQDSQSAAQSLGCLHSCCNYMSASAASAAAAPDASLR